jgi:hypothetical protein
VVIDVGDVEVAEAVEGYAGGLVELGHFSGDAVENGNGFSFAVAGNGDDVGGDEDAEAARADALHVDGSENGLLVRVHENDCADAEAGRRGSEGDGDGAGAGRVCGEACARAGRSKVETGRSRGKDLNTGHDARSTEGYRNVLRIGGDAEGLRSEVGLGEYDGWRKEQSCRDEEGCGGGTTSGLSGGDTNHGNSLKNRQCSCPLASSGPRGFAAGRQRCAGCA